jgi:hypothetical protein
MVSDRGGGLLSDELGPPLDHGFGVGPDIHL